MASLIFTRRIKTPAGVLFDADSVVLRNVANTAGIVRLDTNAVVVAAGTAMPKTSTGVYQYPLTGAIAGVTYRAHVRVTIGSAVYDSSIDAVAPIDTELPSYLTVSAADDLAGKMHGLTAWATATSDAKARVLPRASARFDAARRYQGGRYAVDQTLEFPRIDRDLITTVAGWTHASTPGVNTAVAVPTQILLAVMHEADSLLSGARASAIAAQHDGLASQSIGSASESYRAPTNAAGIPILCPEADMISRRYQLRTGGLL